MNVQRVAAVVAISGAVLGGASIVAFGAGAFGADLPEPPRMPIAAPSVTVPSATPRPTSTATAVAADVDPAAPVVDPLSDDYNPYITPGDPDFIPVEQRAEQLGMETVISKCMAEQGFEYLVAAWWLGEQSQPLGLDYETSIMWLDAYYGELRQDWGISDWTRRGCLGVGEHEAEVARQAGTPLSAPVPEPDPAAPTPRDIQRTFQLAIQTCMTEKGFEYLVPDLMFSGAETMPSGLTEGEVAAWKLAMWGDTGLGSAYRWEDAGCSGYATHVTGQDNMH
jgi:hypothetical protein